MKKVLNRLWQALEKFVIWFVKRKSILRLILQTGYLIYKFLKFFEGTR
jgi:hypothetical protein